MTYYYTKEKTSLKGVSKSEYVENMLEWCSNNKATRFMVTGLRPAYKENLEEEYEELIKKDVVFLILYESLPIGICGIYSINYQSRHAELRILIGETMYHSKGIGKICVSFLIKYCFNNLNLNKVWLGVNEENAGAIKCYSDSGFRIEGILRKELFRNGRYSDIVRMSILSYEYLVGFENE